MLLLRLQFNSFSCRKGGVVFSTEEKYILKTSKLNFPFQPISFTARNGAAFALRNWIR